jgi:hypothetical protein
MTTTMTDTIKITEKVRNYQGNNSFINKMKESLNQWGRLTPKQMEAAEKCLNSQPTKVTVDERPELKRIVEYTGESKFVKDIAEKFQKWGTLTDKQVTAAIAQIDKEEYKEKVLKLRIPTPGETILIGRKIGQQLKETYGLEFNPTLIDITKLLGMSPKAVKFQGKMTVKRSKVCMCCAKTLTDDRSQAEQYREDYLKRVEEIGLMEFWIPKSQIKKWEGDRSIMLEMLS